MVQEYEDDQWFGEQAHLPAVPDGDGRVGHDQHSIRDRGRYVSAAGFDGLVDAVRGSDDEASRRRPLRALRDTVVQAADELLRFLVAEQARAAVLIANFRRDFPEGRLRLFAQLRFEEIRQVYWGYRERNKIRYLGRELLRTWVIDHSPMYVGSLVDIRAYESRRSIVHRRIQMLSAALAGMAKSARWKVRAIETA